MKVAFLDRDGTLIKDYPDEQWRFIDKVEIFPGTIESLQSLMAMGYELIMITNQYSIQDKIISEEKFLSVHQAFIDDLLNHGIKILDTFYCPHNDDAKCCCKKPKPGMILNALDAYPEIDINHCVMFGDSMVDVGLAAFFDIEVYANTKEKPIYYKSHHVKNFEEGVKALIKDKKAKI